MTILVEKDVTYWKIKIVPYHSIKLLKKRPELAPSLNLTIACEASSLKREIYLIRKTTDTNVTSKFLTHFCFPIHRCCYCTYTRFYHTGIQVSISKRCSCCFTLSSHRQQTPDFYDGQSFSIIGDVFGNRTLVLLCKTTTV